MSTYITAKVLEIREDNRLILEAKGDIFREYMHKGFGTVELRMDDGRTISAEQRRKVFALIGDIARWNGDEPDDLRKRLVWDFCREQDIPPFSLKTADMTTAREFINYLIELCFRFDVPSMDVLLHRTDDVSRYLYLCLAYRKCCICGKKADVHHCEGSKIGAGADRRKVHHKGREAIALCRRHHCQIEQKGDAWFFEAFHVYGTKLDEYLCRKLKLKV